MSLLACHVFVYSGGCSDISATDISATDVPARTFRPRTFRPRTFPCDLLILTFMFSLRWDFYPPLIVAINCDETEMVRLLLLSGASVNCKDSQG